MRAFVALTLAIFAAIGVGIGVESGSTTTPSPNLPVLTSSGIGPVHFGLNKAIAVNKLTTLLGTPTQAESSSGCGPCDSEVLWNDLAVEFRLGVFTGYRLIRGGLLQIGSYTPDKLSKEPTTPDLKTSAGIRLNSTLQQVRRAYGPLHLYGTFRWEASNGLVFYDNAETDPDPPTSKIIEIKIGTCGDY